MLELWETRSGPSFQLLPGPLWSRVVAPDGVLSMGQIEGLLLITQSASITGASPSDCFVSYPGHSLGKAYSSAGMRSVYFALPADWAIFFSVYFRKYNHSSRHNLKLSLPSLYTRFYSQYPMQNMIFNLCANKWLMLNWIVWNRTVWSFNYI